MVGGWRLAVGGWRLKSYPKRWMRRYVLGVARAGIVARAGTIAGVKKTRTETEVAAQRAAQRRGMWLGAAAVAIGVLVAVTSGDFVALNCVLTLAAAIAGGRATAIAAAKIDAAGRTAAGVMGGLWAALGFALPFAALAVYRWAILDAAGAAVRLAALSPGELAQLKQFNIQPGLEYFAAGEWSYAFGYLLMAGLFGWLGGLIGAGLSKR